MDIIVLFVFVVVGGKHGGHPLEVLWAYPGLVFTSLSAQGTVCAASDQTQFICM